MPCAVLETIACWTTVECDSSVAASLASTVMLAARTTSVAVVWSIHACARC